MSNFLNINKRVYPSIPNATLLFDINETTFIW